MLSGCSVTDEDQSPTTEHVGSFHLSSIINILVMNSLLCIYWCTYVWLFLGIYYRSMIAELEVDPCLGSWSILPNDFPENLNQLTCPAAVGATSSCVHQHWAYYLCQFDRSKIASCLIWIFLLQYSLALYLQIVYILYFLLHYYSYCLESTLMCQKYSLCHVPNSKILLELL